MRKLWIRSLLVLLVLLLAFSPLYSEVCLSETEMWELETLLAELETLLEEQEMELEFQKIQLTAVSQEIKELELSLKLVETSWQEHEKEQTKKTIAWVIVSLLAGGLAGVVLK